MQEAPRIRAADCCSLYTGCPDGINALSDICHFNAYGFPCYPEWVRLRPGLQVLPVLRRTTACPVAVAHVRRARTGNLLSEVASPRAADVAGSAFLQVLSCRNDTGCGTIFWAAVSRRRTISPAFGHWPEGGEKGCRLARPERTFATPGHAFSTLPGRISEIFAPGYQPLCRYRRYDVPAHRRPRHRCRRRGAVADLSPPAARPPPRARSPACGGRPSSRP